MGILSKKRILIAGIANDRSIGYGIAKCMYREGANLAFSYHNLRLKERIEKYAAYFNSKIVIPCDVTKDKNIKLLFIKLRKFWPNFDGLVHSIAYSPNNQLCGDYVDTVTKKGFLVSHEISSYSFVSMAKFSRPMLNKNASLITLTYLGSERVLLNYNVMGLAKASLESNVRYMAYSMAKNEVRVNAISSFPIQTIASSKIKNFKKIKEYMKSTAPMKRTITTTEIGNVAVFLSSDLSLGITGEVIHVDGGFNIAIMKKFDSLK